MRLIQPAWISRNLKSTRELYVWVQVSSSSSSIFMDPGSKPIIMLLSYICFKWIILWHIWCLNIYFVHQNRFNCDTIELLLNYIHHVAFDVSRASRYFLKQNLLISSLIHLSVTSSFIYPFPDHAIELHRARTDRNIELFI